MRRRPRTTRRCLGLLLATLLLSSCTGSTNGAHPVPVQEVRAIEIVYQQGPFDAADEVHRLRPGPGRRAFVRESRMDTASAAPVTSESVPVQRVGELLWALSAPAVSRAEGVAMVARRVRPARLLETAARADLRDAPGCTANALRGHMRTHLRGAALREQLEAYYDSAGWTDDDVSIRVVIDYKNRPRQVLYSTSQKLQMLPWTQEASTGVPATPRWSVPLSQAVLRLLPATSAAARRLEAREDSALSGGIVRVAEVECRAGQG